MSEQHGWQPVDPVDVPADGRVRSVVAGGRSVGYGIGIKHVLLDNRALGKISNEQLAADYPVWHTSLHDPGWAEYARLCGAAGIRVERRDELDHAMSELFTTPGPALLCIEQDAELL